MIRRSNSRPAAPQFDQRLIVEGFLQTSAQYLRQTRSPRPVWTEVASVRPAFELPLHLAFDQVRP